MERDLLGLSSKNMFVGVKEEITDGSNYSAAPTGASAMQWSFSNKVSPHFLSFSDGAGKTGFDSLTSTEFMTKSTTTTTTAEALNSNHRPSSSSIAQKNPTSDQQAGTHYTMTTYPPQQFDAPSIPRPHEVRILPTANQTSQKISVTRSTTPAHQSFLASSSAGQNAIVSAVNHPQPLGGVPVIMFPASIVPTSTSIVGTTDLRNSSKPYSGGPAQLTIFYAGSVCVYDDVSPEKAQAIMLLAGNGHPATPNKTVPMTQLVEAPVPRPYGVDGFVIGNRSNNTPPCPGLPSPISVISRAPAAPPPQSAGGSGSTADITLVRSIGTLTYPSNKPEPSKVVNSLGPVSATMIPSAVPQARKASLFRFLEKRKERAMGASPYVSKQSPDCSTPGAKNRSFSMNSAGSCPLPAIN